MDKLEKYASAVVRIGVNIQKGQKLAIMCPVDCAYFGRLLMEQAYKAGAEDVMIRWNDEKSARIDYLLAPDSNFGNEYDYEHALIKHLTDENYNVISVVASDPEILNGVDPERITKNQKVGAKVRKPFSDNIMASNVQWTIAAIPSPAWAKKVFPQATSTESAMEQMWEAIYTAARIDDNDPIDNWKAHIANLADKSKKLNDFNFKFLHFKNSKGTDLKIEFSPGHYWLACGEKAKTGNNFVANMPTEEVFTAPHKDGANGIVYSTKPLVYMGDVIDEFWLKFENGKVVEYKAEKGHHLLEKLMTVEANSDRLGEVALVPHDSPISNSGILWFNTLYDENASCHLALGRAYPTTHRDTEGLSDDELSEKCGLNQSLTHNDFMIGSADMEIVGIKADGSEVQVFSKGNFVI